MSGRYMCVRLTGAGGWEVVSQLSGNLEPEGLLLPLFDQVL